MPIQHDVSEVIKQFLAGKCSERGELIREFSLAIQHNLQTKLLLSEICHEAINSKLTPLHSVALGMMYGMTLGVLMEKERTERARHVA